MQINNNELLKLTLLNKNTNESAKNVDEIKPVVILNICADAKKISAEEAIAGIDTVSINGNLAGVNGVMTDEEYAKAVEKITNPKISLNETSQIKLSTTYSDLSPESIQNIKSVIFAIHNPVNPEDTSDYNFLSADKSKFMGVDNLVTWLKAEGSWDETNNGLPVKNLVKLTQNDTLEDNNQDFFGALNRAYQYSTNNELNQDENKNIISYEELSAFFSNTSNNSVLLSDYIDKVELYSQQLQAEYEKFDNQKKLEWAINKTREYLEYMDMTPQIKSLNRLLEMNDLFNEYKSGNIALADLNPGGTSDGITLGAYNYLAYFGDNYDYSGYDIKAWAKDEDYIENNNENVDLGITLDIRLVQGENGYDLGNWYDLINTLVHELTHATAYQYYDSSEQGEISEDGLKQLEALGIIEKGKYTIGQVNSWYKQVQYDSDWNRTYVPQGLLELEYLAYTAWGEYSAYQADADYIDSIAGDVFSHNVSTAVDGVNEKDTIDNHIKDLYNDDDYTEAVPNWKWWSFA